MINKRTLNIVVLGNIDSGKSSLLGHMLFQCGEVNQKTIANYEAQTQRMGKQSFKFAWICDKLSAERNRGISIDSTFHKILGNNFLLAFHDTPGHHDYINNMINCISQADVALFVISAANGEYEAGKSVQGSNREIISMAYTFGLKQIVIAVNKMDDKSVNWNKDRFEEIKNETTAYFNKIGTKGATIATGIVNSGKLRVNDLVQFSPSGISQVQITSIETFGQNINEAVAGDSIGFKLKGISKLDIKKGFICGSTTQDPPKEVKSFTAFVFILNHPNQIQQNYTPILNVHNVAKAVKFAQLIQKVDRKTGEILEENPKFLKNGDAAIVKLVPLKPLCVEKFSDYPQLGRFVCRDISRIVCVGIIKDVEKMDSLLK